MYHAFFRLSDIPFIMTPNPRRILWTQQHQEAAAALTYGITSSKGLMVLTGEPGTGKTTLLAKVRETLITTGGVASAVVFNPTLTVNEFLETVLLDFGIDPVPASKAHRLRRLHAFLLENHAAGGISMLAIDEAHKLSLELLEEVRLLGNFDLYDAKLLQIVLLGQPELEDILNCDKLVQFKQRIALRLSIGPLPESILQRYVDYCWSGAGGELPAPFSADAMTALARHSRRIPRLINSICDNALLLAFADSARTITAKHIDEAARDLHLSTVKQAAAVARPASPAPADNPPPPAMAHLAPVSETLLPELGLRTLANAGRLPLLTRWAGWVWPRRAEMEKS